MAFVDITKAYNIVNKNNDTASATGKSVISLYHSLRVSLKEQREKDKNNMKRLLAKPLDNNDNIHTNHDDDDDITGNNKRNTPTLTLAEALAKVKVFFHNTSKIKYCANIMSLRIWRVLQSH
jgi:hypothetical protein